MGSPARGQGSNCRLRGVSGRHGYHVFNLQRVFEMFINLHDGSLISATVAVIRCYKYEL